MILTVSCGYAPAPGNGPLGKTAWSEILTEGGSTINAAPNAGHFGRPYFDIGIGKAGLLAISPDQPSAFTYYASGQRLLLPANPGDRVHWRDRMAGTVVVWNRSAGFVQRADGQETFAVKVAGHTGPKLKVGDTITFNTTRDIDRLEWAVDLTLSEQRAL